MEAVQESLSLVEHSSRLPGAISETALDSLAPTADEISSLPASLIQIPLLEPLANAQSILYLAPAYRVIHDP